MLRIAPPPPPAAPIAQAPAGPPPEAQEALAAAIANGPTPNSPENEGEAQDATQTPEDQKVRPLKHMFQADKIPQEYAGYQGPEKGPFKCENCDFFNADDSTCHVVAGQVDAEGCCNNFLSVNDPDEPDEDDQDQEAPAPDQAEGGEPPLPLEGVDAGPN